MKKKHKEKKTTHPTVHLLVYDSDLRGGAHTIIKL